jgi:hypothetical protein
MNSRLAVVTALVISLVLMGAPVAGHTHATELAGLFSAECPLSELAHQGPVLPSVELSLVRLERLLEQPQEKAASQISAHVYSSVPPRAPPAS